MATERIRNILMSVNKRVQRLMEVNRFYVALYDPVRAELEFPLVVDNGNPVETGQTPWATRLYQGRALLPDRVIDQRAPLLLEHDFGKRIEEAGVEYWPDDRHPLSWLGAPMIVEDQVIGALVAENGHKPRAFGDSGVRVLSTIARQTAMAVERLRLDERLDRKIADLRAVNEVGRQLTSGIRLSEQEILELIYDQATPLMDTSDMYIALYEPDPSQPDEYNEDQPEKSIIHGIVRFGLAMDNGQRVDTEHKKGWGPRKAGHGLTEYVIRTRQPYRPSDVEKAYKTIATEYIGKIPKSWMGVPMMMSDKVLGVVVLRNDEYKNVYTEDDEEVLQAIAGQAAVAAVAIENARLYKDVRDKHKELKKAYEELKDAQEQILDEERKRLEAERWAYMGRIAGSLAHRIGNKGGMIRLCVQDLEKHLERIGVGDEVIEDQLNTISRSNQYLLSLSDFLFKPQKAIAEGWEKSDVLHYLEDALRYADVPDDVKIECDYADYLPPVRGNKYLVEVFLELVVNAVDAMRFSPEKTLTVSARSKGNWVDVQFADTGSGILSEDKEMVFGLFTQASDRKLSEEGHQGFGLWWVRTFLRELGGYVWYESSVDKGTTFFVRLPVVMEEDYGKGK